MKFFIQMVLALPLFLLPISSQAQITISDAALENLEKFENYRSEACVERSIPGFIPNQRKLEHGLVFERAKWDRYVSIGVVGTLNCPLDYSVSYLAGVVNAECDKSTNEESELCKHAFEATEDSESDSKFLFAENFDNLLTREEHFPWQILDTNNGPASKIAVTLIQKGNIAVKVLISLQGQPVEDLKSSSHGRKIKTRMKKLGVKLQLEDTFFYPAVRFDVFASGVSFENYYLEISRASSKRNGGIKEIPFYGKELKEYQIYSHSVDFFRNTEKDFLNAPYFILKVFSSEYKKGEPLVEIKIDNREFEAVWRQLLEHYKSRSVPVD